MQKYWRYPNITLLVISLLVTMYILQSGWLDDIVRSFGNLGYFGVLIAGLFFVSTFTFAPAAAILFTFAQELPVIPVALLGAAGAMIGDYLAFNFIREKLLAEINPFLKMLRIYKPIDIFHTKYFAWMAPAVGAIVVASPLPDEFGLTLLGLSKMPKKRFLALMFGLNFIGILIIALAANRS